MCVDLIVLYCLCHFLDLKAVESENTCTLPEASGSAALEIDPARENEVLFSYSVHWKVSDRATRVCTCPFAGGRQPTV